MRTPIVLLCLAAVIPATSCGRRSSNAAQPGSAVAQAGVPARVDKAADEAALRAIYQKMPAQLSSADTAAVGALFADDGVEFMSGMPPAQGHDAMTKELASVVSSMKNFTLTVGDATITVADAGDLAVVRAPYRMSYLDAKGKRMEDHGTSLTVFRKMNGQWKIIIDSNISEVAQQ